MLKKAKIYQTSELISWPRHRSFPGFPSRRWVWTSDRSLWCLLEKERFKGSFCREDPASARGMLQLARCLEYVQVCSRTWAPMPLPRAVISSIELEGIMQSGGKYILAIFFFIQDDQKVQFANSLELPVKNYMLKHKITLTQLHWTVTLMSLTLSKTCSSTSTMETQVFPQPCCCAWHPLSVPFSDVQIPADFFQHSHPVVFSLTWDYFWVFFLQSSYWISS